MKTTEKIKTLLKEIMSDKRRRRVFITGSAIIVLLLLIAIGSGSSRRRDKESDAATFTVKRGDFTISLTESGTTENKERAVVRSMVKGRNTIVWIIDEGESVKKGDLLIELDSSNLEEQRLEQQISVENGEANLIQARENLAIVKNQTEADIEKAYLTVKFAGMDLKKYREGEYPQEIQQSEADITIAGEELQRAEDQLEWSTKLHEQGYITRTELQADELALNRTKISLQLAESKLSLLKEYSHERKLEELKSNLKQAEMALERVKRMATANLAQAEASFRAKESEYNQKKRKLEETMEEIEKCRIIAPSDGMVVYATGGRRPWETREPLDVGQEVNEREELIYLPSSDRMMAQIGVPESSRTKIKENMRARVAVDAIPGVKFNGTLTKIGILPDAGMSWLNPDLKVYNCEIDIEGSHEELRPGQGCQVEIIIQELENAIYVPIQCVMQVRGKPTVYVQTWRGSEPVTIETGLDNNRMIHVISGLDEGQEILLSPPLEPSTAPQVSAIKDEKKEKQRTPGEGNMSGQGRKQKPENTSGQ